jgi:hypothetical protein
MPCDGTAEVDVQPTEAQLRRLARVCRDRLGNPRLLKVPDGYPDSLALCTIDAIQSTGVTPASVQKVIARYRAHRIALGGNPETDGIVALLGSFHDIGTAELWARTVGNDNRVSSEPDAPLKAVVIESAATALSDIEIYSAADLREVATYAEFRPAVEAAWTGVAGQRSGVTWRSLLTLAGVPGVKPDRVIMRFVAGAVGLDAGVVEPDFAVEAIERTAADLGVPSTALDHAAWKWQRAR